MKLTKLLTFLLSVSLLAGCQSNPRADIVTSLFPQYDFARQIVGDKLSVSLLVPPGAEAHDYEPTSRDLEAIRASKLFIFTAYEWDTWLGNDVSKFVDKGLALNIFENIDLEHIESEHDEEHDATVDHDDHDHGSMHFWTNPKVAIEMLEVILDAIVAIDPTNRDFYINNANNYISKLNALDETMHEYFETTSSNKIFFAGHNAMEFFAERFHLEIEALTEGFQPDADITSTQLENLIKNIENNGAKFIFVEELKEPKIANTIKNELSKKGYNISILELHGYHNVTKKQLDDKISYLDLMNQNFNNLKQALKP